MDNIIEHKNNKMKRKLSKIKFSDEKIASVQAIMFYAVLLLLYSCTQ